ncbi:MAG: hypothetical protein V1822_00730 [Candidatus Micrarchaeota archaeon]
MAFRVAPERGKSALKPRLEEKGIGFLYPFIKDVKNIEALSRGLYGKMMLSELGVMAAEGNTNEISMRRNALAGFEALSGLHNSFMEKYAQYSNMKNKLERFANAFYDMAKENKLVYQAASSSVLKCINESRMDCDISTFLAMQLASEVGITLKAVSIPPQVNGGIGHIACVQIDEPNGTRKFFDVFLCLVNQTLDGKYDAQRLKGVILKNALCSENVFESRYPKFTIIESGEELNTREHILDLDMQIKKLMK